MFQSTFSAGVPPEGARQPPSCAFSRFHLEPSWHPLQAVWLCPDLNVRSLLRSGNGRTDFLSCLVPGTLSPGLSWVHCVLPFTAASWPRRGGGCLQGHNSISPALVTSAHSLNFQEEHPAHSKPFLMWESVSQLPSRIHPPGSVSTGGGRHHVLGRRQVWVPQGSL